MCRLFFLQCWLILFALLQFSNSFVSLQNSKFDDFLLSAIRYRDVVTNRNPKHKHSFRAGKIELVKSLKEQLNESQAILQFRVTRMNHGVRSYIKDNIMKHIEAQDGKLPYKMQIVKNTMMSRAIAGTRFEALTPNLEKTNLYFFVYDDTIVPKLVSVINGMRLASKIVKWRFEPSFACFDNTVIDSLRLRCLSSLPEKSDLCARIPHFLRLPVYRLIDSLRVSQSLVNSLNQIYLNLNSTISQIKNE
uniref:Ribosomal protein L10, putative n=1 Tax=Theileria annulata TaxID=5874 RepID=A0A3B0MFR6_THEAN